MTRAKSKPVQLGWPTFQVYKEILTGAYTYVKSTLTLALGFNGPTPCKGTVCYDYSRYTLERFGPRAIVAGVCCERFAPRVQLLLVTVSEKL